MINANFIMNVAGYEFQARRREFQAIRRGPSRFELDILIPYEQFVLLNEHLKEDIENEKLSLMTTANMASNNVILWRVDVNKLEKKIKLTRLIDEARDIAWNGLTEFEVGLLHETIAEDMIRRSGLDAFYEYKSFRSAEEFFDNLYTCIKIFGEV